MKHDLKEIERRRMGAKSRVVLPRLVRRLAGIESGQSVVFYYDPVSGAVILRGETVPAPVSCVATYE